MRWSNLWKLLVKVLHWSNLLNYENKINKSKPWYWTWITYPIYSNPYNYQQNILIRVGMPVTVCYLWRRLLASISLACCFTSIPHTKTFLMERSSPRWTHFDNLKSIVSPLQRSMFPSGCASFTTRASKFLPSSIVPTFSPMPRAVYQQNVSK